MTCVECGIPLKQVDVAAIWEGYDLAYPGRSEKYDVSYANQSAHPDEDMKEESEEEPSGEQLARIETLSV